MLIQRIILLTMLGFSVGFSKASQEELGIIDLTEDDNASEHDDGENRIELVDQDARVAASVQLKDAVVAQDVNGVKRLLETYSNLDHKHAFYQAIANGHIEIAKLFLAKKEVDINSECIGVLPLCIALTNRRKEIARLLIDAGADLNKRGRGCPSSLYLAALRDDFDMVKLLVERGMRIKGIKWGCYSPLGVAARNGNMEMLQFFFDHGFRVNISQESYSAAHEAAVFGKLETLKYLLQQNADLATYASGRGETPIYLAAGKGHLNCVKMLVKDYNVPVDELTNSHYTPLMYAAQRGFVDVVRYLMSHGARLDQRSKRGKFTALDLAKKNNRHDVVNLLSHPEQVHAEGQQEADGLPEDIEPAAVADQLENEDVQEVADRMQGIQHNQPAVVNPEAEHECMSPASVEARNEQNQRSSGLSEREEFMQKIETGHIVHVVKVLQRSKAFAQGADARGYTPLHHAARHGKFAIFRLLMSVGASINCKDTVGYTPLHYAALGGNKDLVNFLMQKGLLLLSEANNGKTALDLAVEKGHPEIVALFFDKLDKSQKIAVISSSNTEGEALFCHAVKSGNANLVSLFLETLENTDKMLLLNRPTKHGALPLHEAAKRGLHAVGRLLIENGAAVLNYDRNGLTPLHYAVVGGDTEMVRVLMDAGAVVQLQNRNHETALDSAKRGNKQEIIDLLQRSGRDAEESASKRQRTR